MQLRERDHTVDALRGIAALLVAWRHCSNGMNLGAVFSFVALYGGIGVQMFFVISGFVIPLSMYRAGYQLPDFGRFVAKRVTRIDPPYLVNIALVGALALTLQHFPGYHGLPVSYTLPQLALHFGYLNDVFQKPWVADVYWTLAIEFQFYLFIGLLLPLLASRRAAVRLLSLMVLLTLPFVVPTDRLVFRYLPLFAFGVLVFWLRSSLISRNLWVLATAITATVSVFAEGRVETLGALITAMLIAFVPIRSRLLLWFGTISYSIYLMHMPIGVRVVNVGMRVASGWVGEALVFTLGMAASVGAAYVMYRLVELPSQRLSQRWTYRKNVAAEPTAASAVAGG